MSNKNLKEKLRKLPRRPGVYLLKDSGGAVLYVGKATSLQERVRSHFRSGYAGKELLLTGRVKDVEVIPVANPSEALLLENQLIKKYQPRYNTNLKDGKSYPLVKITHDRFPALRIVREERSDRASYYGPFTSVENLRRLVRFLRVYYPVRTCSNHTLVRGRPCTQYHLKRCCAPCAGFVSEEEYRSIVGGVKAFFSGRYEQFQEVLKRQLRVAVRQLNFEEAQKLKERLELLQDIVRKFPGRPETELVAYGQENVLQQLAECLRLETVPGVVEGYDVSFWRPGLATGSKVTFRGGLPDKKEYRHFHLQRVSGIDDYRMLQEILERRFTGSGKDRDYPDLILVDGGKGQLTAAEQVLERLKVNIPVVALAKENEEIYLPGQRAPLRLSLSSPVLQFLQRVRNEAHRFALNYARKLLRRRTLDSFLEEIPGLGPVGLSKIKNRFSDLAELAQADVKALQKLGLSGGVAQELIRRFRSGNRQQNQ
ncbi:MAG TPA: excinuclease ABC subunit UvrC [bacterium]|nr:excinuclease ABC subunit UvrC [bacterium]